MTRTMFSRPARLLVAAALALGLLLSLLPAVTLAAPPSETDSADPSLARLDLDGDGRISDIDIQYVTTAWESRRLSGAVCSGTSQADVNGDGCLDIADVQTVAGNVGVAVLAPAARAETQSALAAANPTFVVTTASDASDSNPGDGVCQIAGGGCSLRAAIDEANRMPGGNTINFNIPGSGPHVINVTAVESDDRAFTLSDTTGPTIINGYSQPGSVPNTSPTVSNAVIKIHIKGPRVANTSIANYQSIDGFRVFSAGNEFRGLAFTHLRRSIWLSGGVAHDNIVAGCFIGTDPAGQPWYESIIAVEGRDGDAGAFGMWLTDGAHHNRVGGTVPADRTVISGNAEDGGGGSGAGTEYNQFIGLIVGLSPDGTRRVRNVGDGLDLNFGMSHTQVGGLAPGERNVISGNAGEGVEISHDPSTAYNTIAGNYFGVAPDGNTIHNNVEFNSGYSVSLEDSVSNTTIANNVMVNSWKGGVHIYGALGSGNVITGNRIGLTLNGTANTLSANRGDGIRIRFGASDVTVGPDNIITNSTKTGVLVIDNASQLNTITGNAIYGNGLLGIDLGGTKDSGGDGVTPNDGAWGSGPNQRIDFPVITAATTTTVSGTALTGYRVEIFVADAPAGQYGEGKAFVGSGVANGSGQFTIPVSGVPAGSVVTATATDSAGNTSEFALNVAVSGGAVNAPPSAGIVAPSDGSTVSGSVTIAVNASDAEDAAGSLNVQIRIDGGAWQAASWNAGSNRYQFAWNTTTAANGGHTIEARATDSAGSVATAGPINVSVSNVIAPGITLPALIQAEDYNTGGEGVGYHDTTAGNTGGRYRTDDVDMEHCTDATTPAGQTCVNVGWTAAGEWLAYSVRVPSAGSYTFALRVATPSNNRSVQLQLDGVNLGAPVAVPNTGGYQAWTTVSVVRQLPAGDHELRLVINSTNLNLNYIDITSSTVNTPPTVVIATPAGGATVSGATTVGVTATDSQDAAGTLSAQVRIDGGAWQPAGWNASAGRYQLDWNTTDLANGPHTLEARATDSGGATGTASAATVTVDNATGSTAVPLPATLQAEDYVDYHDADAGNVGGAYRDDDVDIAACSDGSGCLYVGWTIAGEWLAYSVSNTSSATYTFQMRYASPYSGRRVKVEVDGAILSTVSLPASGGWDTWRTAAVGTTTLAPGQHTIRLLIDLDGLNVNWLSIT